jgi:hypothetical protein
MLDFSFSTVRGGQSAEIKLEIKLATKITNSV